MRDELLKLVAAVDVVEPEPPMTDVDRFEPFPVDTLPEPVRSFVIAGAKSIGCDPSYVAAFMLPVLASAIGSSRRLRLKRRWTVPAILWAAIVDELGTAKSPAYQLAKRLIDKRHAKSIRDYQEMLKQHEQEFLRYEIEVAAWKKSKGAGDPPTKPEQPAPKRYRVEDTTAEALAPILAANLRGVLNVFDELRG